MKTTSVKQLFHYISYLQYPIMLVALLHVGWMYYDLLVLETVDSMLVHVNNGLLFMGIAISFSTLQDTSKTQNKFSRRIWEHPKKGRIMLIILFAAAMLLIAIGAMGLVSTAGNALSELSLGVLVLGLGMMGLLRVAIEMYENHRLDKKIS